MNANPSTQPEIIDTDALIIGAGPVGLFQLFELGLLEVRAHIVDSLNTAGGQCVELYADKPIYDIPALPFCTGQQLTDNLLKQIAPFKPQLHLNQEVASLIRRGDGRFDLATSTGQRFVSTTVFIAAGAGSFQPRKLALEGIQQFEERQLWYQLKNLQTFVGQKTVVYGNTDTAIQSALTLVAQGIDVTLVHRRNEFKANAALIDHMRAQVDTGQLKLVIGQATDFIERNGKLVALELTAQDGTQQALALDQLLVFYGLSPKLGPIADWGLAIEGRQLLVDTEKFETAEPGIFAVGDVNTYPGKRKLILCGFHEATLAAFAATRYVFPQKKIHLQYTTTSTRLHQLLGTNSSHA